MDTDRELTAQFTVGERRYSLAFDYLCRVRVLEVLGVDLMKLYTDKAQLVLLSNADYLLRVVWMVSEKADLEREELHQLKDGRFPERMLQFLAGFDDAAVERATDALLDAAILFFQPAKRPALIRVREAMEKLAAHAVSKLNQATQSEAFEEAMNQARQQIDKDASTPTRQSA